MTGRRPPVKPGSVAKKIERQAVIREQIEREKERYGRKLATLGKQTEAARRITGQGQRDLALARVDGQREDERIRHRDKIGDLNERVGKICR